MRTTKVIAVAVALCLSPLSLAAQENLKAAFKEFINQKGVTNSTFIEKDEATGKPLSYFYQHAFSLPMSSRKQLNAVLEAFHKDVGKAYVVYQRGQRSNGGGGTDDASEPFVTMTYGRSLDKGKSYGNHANRNYNIMLVRDKQDSLCRYAYAVVWYVDSATNRLCGTLDEMYGKDPQRVKRQQYLLSPNGNYKIFNGSGQFTMRGSEALAALREINENESGEYVINNSMDFFKRFGNLRAAYKTSLREGGVDDTTLNTGLVNKIVELCKKYGGILSTAEQDVCVNSLKEMQADTYDKYLKQLLGIGIKSLRP